MTSMIVSGEDLDRLARNLDSTCDLSQMSKRDVELLIKAVNAVRGLLRAGFSYKTDATWIPDCLREYDALREKLMAVQAQSRPSGAQSRPSAAQPIRQAER